MPLRWVHLVVAALLTLAWGECALADSIADREIMVMFRPGIVSLPSGTTKVDLASASIASPSIDNLLSTLGTEEIAEGFPGVGPADTVMTAYAGGQFVAAGFSDVYRLLMPIGTDVDAVIASLSAMDEVIYAEPNPVAVLCAPQYPTDDHFVNGDEWHLWSVGGVDVDGPQAWEQTTGINRTIIAILDSGFDPSNGEFSGRVLTSESDASWDATTDHGFMVAGIAAASANNGGVAGVDWHCRLISRVVAGADTTLIASQIMKAAASRAHVMNNSYSIASRGQNLNSNTVRMALAVFYRQGGIATAAMDNGDMIRTVWPAAYKQGVIAVGATSRTDTRWHDGAGMGSNMGAHIDLCAPGEQIMSCGPNGTYPIASGTSFATPIVSGAAALLLSQDSTLQHDDVQNILQLSAKPLGPAGWDSAFGYGRVNVARALNLLNSPNLFERNTATGGIDSANTGQARYPMTVLGAGMANNGNWWVVRHEIRRHVSFSTAFTAPPSVWGRGGFGGGGTAFGASADTINFNMEWCEPVPGSITTSGCTMRTYIYERFNTQFGGSRFDWWPGTAAQVIYRWGALQVREVDADNSYYVPEAVVGGVVKDGLSTPKAYQLFHGCPNNDAGSYPALARVRVVVKDTAGNGIANISPSDIFVLFNGGSPVQGFIGDGSDSVVANSQFSVGTCPDVKILTADSATDAAGATYITFVGAGGTSDPGRKWGHFDSEMPIYVRGTKISGRLSDASAANSYRLEIKSADRSGGLSLSVHDHGELVDSADLNTLLGEYSPLYGWWSDLDSSGTVNSTDFSIMTAHWGHTCSNP